MEIILLLVLLGLSAVFSGSETAYFSLGETELARLGREPGSAGHRVSALLERSHDLLSALLIGNLLVNTAASVVATAVCLDLFGSRGLVVAVPAMTLALLFIGEITPKMLSLRYSEHVAVLVNGPLRIWLWITGPLLKIIGFFMKQILRMLPETGEGATFLSVAELQTACDLAVEDGTLTETEGRSLARLLQLEDLEVRHIMTPRTTTVSLRQNMPLKQVLATARRAGFNRYPVLAEDGDRPVGLFHLKDLLSGQEPPEFPLRSGLREILFVPETKDVAALLKEMRGGGSHLFAVVDEHGDFTGIVTMADCLQAIMGPVADQGSTGADIIPLGGGRWVITGLTDLRILEEDCGIRLPASRDYNTVAGFMMTSLGRVLTPGDRVTLPEARMTVLEMSGHRVDRIQVTRLAEGRPDSGPGGGK